MTDNTFLMTYELQVVDVFIPSDGRWLAWVNPFWESLWELVQGVLTCQSHNKPHEFLKLHVWLLKHLALCFCFLFNSSSGDQVFGVRVLVVYFCIESASLLVADFILFWASRCVIPSVLTPSMAEMMSPWARLPPAALLPGVIYGRVNRAGYTSIKHKLKGIKLHKLMKNFPRSVWNTNHWCIS